MVPLPSKARPAPVEATVLEEAHKAQHTHILHCASYPSTQVYSAVYSLQSTKGHPSMYKWHSKTGRLCQYGTQQMLVSEYAGAIPPVVSVTNEARPYSCNAQQAQKSPLQAVSMVLKHPSLCANHNHQPLIRERSSPAAALAGQAHLQCRAASGVPATVIVYASQYVHKTRCLTSAGARGAHGVPCRKVLIVQATATRSHAGTHIPNAQPTAP